MELNKILIGDKIKTRILRPSEYEILRQGAKVHSNQINLDACLVLGARYEECKGIQEHPQWFGKKKVKTQNRRRIRLSNIGESIMPDFISNKRRLPPTPQGWQNNLHRWAKNAGLDPTGLSPRSLRKTWESWLLTVYPELSIDIYQSQGHSEIVSLKHYRGLPFSAQDRDEMKKWTEGYDEGIVPLTNIPIPEVAIPLDFNLNMKDTMGFSATSDLIIDLISLISMPVKGGSEFGKIVLHFDSNRREIWWSNSATGGIFFVNFGYATYDYFTNCWGDGAIGINAEELLKYLKMLKTAKEVTFWGNLIYNKYCIQDEKDKFIHNLEGISEIRTSMPRINHFKESNNIIKLDDNYIPIMKEEMELKYGTDLDVSELKLIVSRGEKLGCETYSFDILADPPGLVMHFGDNERKLTIKEGSFVPLKEDIHHEIGNKLEAPAFNLKGTITLRASEKEKTPLYLLKKEDGTPNGIMKTGILLGTK